MPLLKKKKAQDMEDKGPQAQDLAIAYHVKANAKPKKKMASGGEVKEDAPPSAKSEQKQTVDNSSKADMAKDKPKSKVGSGWVDPASAKEASGSKAAPKPSRSAMAPSSAFNVRDRDMEDDESALIDIDGPASPMEEPKAQDDEKAPDHSGESEEDMIRRHAEERATFAKGGKVAPPEGDMVDMEELEDKPKSMAEAIRRKKMKGKMYAEGGMVDLDEASEESENVADDLNFDAIKKEQYDLDQLSSQPEGSNAIGDDIASDIHSMVSKIRSKIKARI